MDLSDVARRGEVPDLRTRRIGSIARIGLTPVKGMAHLPRPSVDLTMRGPREDRAFCLVDVTTDRVLRTVDNDSLLACRATWVPPVLTVATPLGEATVTVTVSATSSVRRSATRVRSADYWGRTVSLVEVGGPCDALLSAYLNRPVALCQVVRASKDKPRGVGSHHPPGGSGVVWGGAVSLVTTSSVAEVARRTGSGTDDGARFRATFVVDTGSSPPFAEDSWTGHRLRIGDAVVGVRGPQPRCAVIDRRPGAGGRDVEALKALARDRRVGKEIVFGVDADVVSPGHVWLGSPVLDEAP